MRLANILALLCSTAALILSFLVLFAGHTRTFLQGDDMLTLNISRLGHGTVDLFNSSDSDGSFLDNLINSAEAKLDEELDQIVGEVSSDIAEAINLPDFYSVHVMDFCSGTFEPNASLAAIGNGSHVSKNTTFCSNSSGLFHFSASKAISSALPDGINLTTIEWPQEITDAENAVKIASLVMEVFYIIGIIFTGIAFLLALVSVFANGRITACGSFFLDMLAFISLLIPSIIATIIIIKAVHAVNKYGKFVGVSATIGGTWLGMTWAATGLMFLASILACVTIVVGGHHRRGSRGFNEKSNRY